MYVKTIKTHSIKLNESLEAILDQYILNLNENSVLAITSKVISICQGRVVATNSIEKQQLIQREADVYLPSEQSKYGIFLTIKNGMLIPSAGIDESNSEWGYILYPENIQMVAEQIWQFLRSKFSIKNFGVIITDSTTTPLRLGVTGICIGWCGFEPLYNYVGKPDIFGKSLRFTQINLLDALAASVVLEMGEGDERTPIALLSYIKKIKFMDSAPSPEQIKSIRIDIDEDLYSPLLKAVAWKTFKR